ncbi:LysE family translocator [Acinetobacter junii]|uniref:LysE family translocator n=2 Tax=Acinetobacter junii TaxID=40215 RepID=UPI000F65D265|nr:LysE family translocator [Acinetobacter junii]MDH1689503.1 LysE family translocator [Acinetobacter junii]MEB8380543.1 LysE family translocator [Acinetobacter junii]RSE38184.1 LysE family translocator [Acinetobacter junii]USR72495.1 LysE family translocator [Acinetobacter junii]WRL34324.1 LysE family translocator [Acinetobacter junii]
MLTLLIPYLIAITLLTITPGLDTTLIIRTATIEGKAKAFQAALGITLGCIVWGVVVACGLGALLMTSDLAFNMLKWMGAAYLAWLGLNLLLKPRTQLADINDTTNTQNWFVKGFLGNLLNPKVGVFYLSFLPQFIPHTASSVIWTMGLVMIHVVIGIIWSIILISAMQSISAYLKRPKFIKYMDRITGSIFILDLLQKSFFNQLHVVNCSN